MNTHEITAPDGRKFEVNAPDGASQEDILAYVKAHHADNPIQNIINNSSDLSEGSSKLLRNLTTGIGSGIIGGGKGLYSLATGGSGEDALKQMHDYQTANTYQPPVGSVGANAINKFNSPYNPITWPGMAVNAASEKLQANGYPKSAAGLEGAFGVSPLIGAAGGLFKKPSISSITEPSVPASIPIDKWTQLNKTNSTFRDAGSAATPYTEQAKALNIHPSIVDAIKQSEDAGVLNQEAAQRHIDAASLPHQIELTAGQATGDVNQLSHEQNRRGAEPAYAQRFNDQNSHLVQNIDVIHDTAAPDVYHLNHVDAGASLIDAYKAKDQAIKSYIKDRYKDLEAANGGAFPIDGVSLASNAIKALHNDDAFDFLPSPVLKKLTEYSSGKPMSFQNFETFRTILAKESRKAENPINSDGNAVHAIKLVRNALEDFPLNGAAQHLKPIADIARNAAKKRFGLLDDDPAYEAAIHDKVAPDDFIKKFVINGKVDKIKAMQENLKENPLASQTIASGTINFLKHQAGIREGSGNFTQSGYNKALGFISPKLNDLVDPSTATNLTTLGKVAKYTQEQPRGAFVNNSNTLVGGLANKAGEAAWTAADAKTLGATKIYRDFVTNAKLKEKANQSLAPGAGVNTLDYPKQ
jgi:hypothetical protein